MRCEAQSIHLAHGSTKCWVKQNHRMVAIERDLCLQLPATAHCQAQHLLELKQKEERAESRVWLNSTSELASVCWEPSAGVNPLAQHQTTFCDSVNMFFSWPDSDEADRGDAKVTNEKV